MAENHPNELELLSYVEEELPAAGRREVAEHLVACRSCAEKVRLLERGRAALRAAPLLELPEGRRQEIVSSLPGRRDRWRPLVPLRRGLLVAAPVAAAAVLVAVFVVAGLPGGGGDADEQAGDAAAEATIEMAQEDAAGAEEGRTVPGELVRSVAGPPSEVLRILVNEGIEAEIVDDAVVADSRAGEVETALGGRPDGPVEVYVR